MQVLRADGAEIRIGGSRLRALTLRLALDAGRAVSVRSLSLALWPEASPVDPPHAVQSLVSRLRRVALEDIMLVQVPGGYRLDLPADAVDALRFERLARAGYLAVRNGDWIEAERALREALALWRGDALADAAGAPYAVAVARRLGELRLSAIEDLLTAKLEASVEPFAVAAALEELVTAYPLRERLRELQVRVLHAAGRRAEALNAYQAFRTLLADQWGVDPGPALKAAHLAVLRNEHPAGRARDRQPCRAVPEC